MPYRVIQWYTGSIAREQIRLIAQHPELTLVGAVVHHAEKVGRDAGEIAGIDPLGVKTVGRADEALGLDADVVLYNSPFERYDEILQILAAGKNVITPSAAFYPKSRPEFADLQAASTKGQSSLLGTGVNPGFGGDLLPLVASSLCARVRGVHIRENGDLRGWDPFLLTEVMRFGRAVEVLEADPDYFDFMTNSFQQACRMLAEALAFDVESVRTRPAFARAREDMLGGRVKAGTVGGIHLQVSVMAAGNAVVTEDLMWRVGDALDPDWSVEPHAGVWKVHIDGDPGVHLNVGLSGGGSDAGAGTLGTAARMINSIPDVCAAAPGLLTVSNAPMPRCWNTPGEREPAN